MSGDAGGHSGNGLAALADLEGVTVEAEGAPSVVLRVEPGRAPALLARLRDEPGRALRRLVDLTAIDRLASPSHPEDAPRFELVYRLRSSATGRDWRIHVPVAEAAAAALPEAGADAGDEDRSDDGRSAGEPGPIAESVAALWPAAGWLEREVHELFGIRFHGHPDLRPLLREEGFEGAPLRKDAPRRDGAPRRQDAPFTPGSSVVPGSEASDGSREGSGS